MKPYEWQNERGLYQGGKQVLQLVPNYCSLRRRNEIGKALVAALNAKRKSPKGFSEK